MKFNLTFLFAILCSVKEFHFQEIKNRTEKIIFNEKKTLCPLYSGICNIYLQVDENLNLDDLILESSSVAVFLFDSIESCTNIDTNRSVECNSLSLNERNDSRKTFKISILPVLIGKANLSVRIKDLNNQYNHNHIINYNVIVSTPKRTIDLIFTIWTWVFQTLISFLMGVLIDRDSLIKIIKMPKAIFVGFFCQYLIMPLVI